MTLVPTRAFDESLVRYDANYENSQDCSSAFARHVDRLVRHLVYERDVRGTQVLEVGCGKGAFLRRVVAEDSGNRGVGFDPSYVGPLSDLDGRVRFERRYFDESCTGIEADLVLSRHVIEHIPAPAVFLAATRKALTGSDRPRIFLETPCVEWILREGAVWDFFYEHCSYFTERSLTTAVELAGFAVTSLQKTFGGQYLWLEAALATPATREPRDGAEEISTLASQFATTEVAVCERLQRVVEDRVRRGRGMAIWGAGAKGVTLANIIDPDCQRISCIVDVNPRKQGCYLPGTGHVIVAPQALPQFDVAAAILMNPNYREEVRSLLRTSAMDVELIDAAG